MDYVNGANWIVDHPTWYNALSANCTTSIYRHSTGRMPWDWRILINGTLDQMFYDAGRLYQDMPFAELREKSWINDRANSASADGFGQAIRKGLPGF